MSNHCPFPFKLVADSAFPCKNQFRDKILSVPKRNTVDYANETNDPAAQIRNAIVTKHRQPAEWGMRTIQGGFGRLKVKVSADSVKRARLFIIVWHLHNFRTRTVGLNQTATVYKNLWAQYE